MCEMESAVLRRAPSQTDQNLGMSRRVRKTLWVFPSRSCWRLCKAVGARFAHSNLYFPAATKNERRVRPLPVPGERSTKGRGKIARFSNDYGVFTIP